MHAKVRGGQVRIIDRDDRLAFVFAQAEQNVAGCARDHAALWREIRIEKRALTTGRSRHVWRKDEGWHHFRGSGGGGRVHAAFAGLEPADADVVGAGGLIVPHFDVVGLARFEPEEVGFAGTGIRPAAIRSRRVHHGTEERAHFFVVVGNP